MGNLKGCWKSQSKRINEVIKTILVLGLEGLNILMVWKKKEKIQTFLFYLKIFLNVCFMLLIRPNTNKNKKILQCVIQENLLTMQVLASHLTCDVK
jgi:hypothetical protein